MANILVIGNATLDVVSRVSAYPGEDDEVRALARYSVRGGNGANTSVMLARLGHAVSFVGTLADDAAAGVIRADLEHHGVDTRLCQSVSGGQTPMSCITLSEASGSRTIVHFRDLPELDVGHLAAHRYEPCDWIHIEARDTLLVTGLLAALGGRAPVSLEVEKERPGIDRHLASPELLILGKDFVLAQGHASPEDYLRCASPGVDTVCPWGARGAWLRGAGGAVKLHPADVPARVVDTLGAGDVFNAGLIHGRLRGLGPDDAVKLANRLAGRKCAVDGFAAVDLEGF